MKRIVVFGISLALCAACFAGCDMGNGLIAELFGNNVGDYVPGGDVVLVDPIESYPDVQTDVAIGVETWTEIATEPPVDYPVDETIGCETDTDCIEPAPWLSVDGDLSEWSWSDCWKQDFDASNLDPWIGEVGDGGYTMYVSCDTQYVYIAFDVRDTTPVYSEDGTYNGDCFQIQIDFNGWMAYTEQFERGIFYSFGLQKDGTMDVTVHCIGTDATADVDYTMASDDEPEWRNGEVLGATKIKQDGSGWVAELAISWDTLYRDACEKLALVGVEIPVIENWAYAEISLSALVCYIDRNENDEVLGAWGTPKVPGSLISGEGWYPEGCGLEWVFNPAWPSVYGQYR